MTDSIPKNSPTNDPLFKPWYKQFWPWFIIALPASAVIASLITVYIAFDGADSLVYDDYYKRGLAINIQHAKQRKAAENGYAAMLERKADNSLILKFDNLSPKAKILLLSFIHPADSKKDFSIELLKDSEKTYRAKTSHDISGRWYLRLTHNEEWMIKSEISKTSSRVHLAPNLN